MWWGLPTAVGDAVLFYVALRFFTDWVGILSLTFSLIRAEWLYFCLDAGNFDRIHASVRHPHLNNPSRCYAQINQCDIARWLIR